jgi:rubrerythrin
MKKILVVLFVSIFVFSAAAFAQPAQPKTLSALMEAITGETQAAAKYRAFADAAEKEGHAGIAMVFRATADSEQQHAADQFALAQGWDPSVERPQPEEVEAGTTKENLQAAIDGETYEFTEMYPRLREVADSEGILDARGIFTLAKLAEEVHAGIYKDLLDNIDNFNGEKYGAVYRCPECGNIIYTTRPNACPICGDPGDDLIEYVLAP